ncbi:glycoside hydrolase superfamily [Gymnopilus junonius]|uniref:Glycoside hydrolase superfamily n=1 Tax=Gymnopilus junonius TaxID=109634 RepID=A0A9P5P036_GYMJU|nr:glycoside hydrolase superfamily [Gymnopilus junonius]
MRSGPSKGLLPLGLIFFCLEAIFLLSGSPVAARRQQQCKLQPRGNQVTLQAPTNTGIAGGAEPSATAIAHSGGWLVLEPWITPSLFQSTNNPNIVDEFTLGQLLDPETAQIPIGYWSIPLDSSSTSGWAEKYDINVILDLHGAPGSQNGYDNSGQRTSNPVWALNPSNVTRTVDTLRFLANEVGDQISVLELLNEGAGFLGNNWASVIRQFFSTAYGSVRSAVGNDLNMMIGDAFLGVSSWTDFLTAPQGTGVLMDFHEYQIFSDLELDRTFDEHISFACTYMQSLGSFAAGNLWTVVGEWSNAVTDCAPWLNGRNTGARWDGSFPGSQTHGNCTGFTGNYTGWTQDYKDFLRKYWEVQVEVGENVNGWIFWTWKAENADEWSYQRGLQGGWIPQDPTDRMYPGICSS